MISICVTDNQHTITDCMTAISMNADQLFRTFSENIFMVSSSNLKYKLMRRDFQPITFLDCSRTDLMYLYMK